MSQDELYKSALRTIDDLTPFIDLANDLDNLSKLGRINDMRRRLVIFITANHARVATEARQQEHEWLFSKFGDTDASTRDWELIYNEAQARLNSLDRPTATGTEGSKQ